MKVITYIIRCISHYRKQHLALFLGMAVSATVLTGALIIGDSIRYSLNRMVEIRLGKTQFAVIGGSRFMDVNLAGKMTQSLKTPVAPVLMMQGIVISAETGDRINKAAVIGIDSSINGLNESPVGIPGDDEAVIGSAVAKRLNIEVGDDILIRVESANLIPVNAPFAQEPAPTVAFRVKVLAIAGDDQLGRLNLGNDQSVAYNVFMSTGFLSTKLELPGLVNTLLIAGEHGQFTQSILEKAIQSQWSLKDLGLSGIYYREKGIYDLVSNRIFIDTVVENVINRDNLFHQEVITYLINDIEINGNHTPYSFASAVSSTFTGTELKDDEVIINQWTAEDLGAHAGDSVKLTYYEIGQLRELRETSRNFIVRAIIKNNTDFIDSSLMPRFQGFSQAGNCSDWNAGVPVDLKRIRDKDERYWDDYRGTPKVLLSLNAGKELWKNQFGTLTAIRFQESRVAESRVAELLLNSITPPDIGLQVMDVRGEGNRAAGNAVDFTELFLGMSFFIIVAGVLLTVLIYTLHFNRRSSETALLSSLGFEKKMIVRLRLLESSLVILSGSIAGALLGILYNYALLAGLNSVWNDMVRTDVLTIHVRMDTLLMGIVSSMVIALVPLYVVTVKKLGHPLAQQLKGNTIQRLHLSGHNNKARVWGFAMLIISLVLVVVSLSIGAYNNATLYLSSAAFVLTGSAMVIYSVLRKPMSSKGYSVPTIHKLAVTNLQRNPSRSLSVILLLALGTFTVVLTGANRKTFYGTENQRSSGTGGYLLWAETTSPVTFDLNSNNGKDRLLMDSVEEVSNVRFLQFSKLEGDEASCLNLNQVQRPRLLAVNPDVFDSAGAFSFAKLLPGISKEHPWTGLDVAYNDSTYPAYLDQTVLQYSIQKKLGDTLKYMNEYGRPLRLILAGTFNNSIFQGNLLISNKVFSNQFPSSGGSGTMLVDAPENKRGRLTEILSQSLVDYGINVTSTSERLATFYSVENTYLTVFMVLSGLGFIIGTIGLGIILLRNLYERRRELALFLALGFSHKQMFIIVFTENFILLTAGFFTGLLAALVGILPSLISPFFDIQGWFLIALTSGIFLSGFLWIYFPLQAALRKPLIPALRND
jgi:putative ABC transport system permease protein